MAITLTEPYSDHELKACGVRWLDLRQTYVDRSVDLARLRPGSTVYPGCRLSGPRTYLGAGTLVGSEGPATLHDCVVGAHSEIGSGFLDQAVLVAQVRIGPNAYLRPVTLLEEQSSIAHAVGLKQTFLLSFVTLGSLINFCDGLVAGGTSRQNHTEIGSGFIHFNFTPWGRSGDKATPSLVGDVSNGVFLRSARVFLGGMGGVVGPRQVDYGALVVAGTVVRRDVAAGTLHAEGSSNIHRPTVTHPASASAYKLRANLRYLAQLVALRAWYSEVRAPRARLRGDTDACITAEAGVNAISAAIDERHKRLSDYGAAFGLDVAAPATPASTPAPFALDRDGERDHLDWVRGLSDDEVAAGARWLEQLGSAAVAGMLAA